MLPRYSCEEHALDSGVSIRSPAFQVLLWYLMWTRKSIFAWDVNDRFCCKTHEYWSPFMQFTRYCSYLECLRKDNLLLVTKRLLYDERGNPSTLIFFSWCSHDVTDATFGKLKFSLFVRESVKLNCARHESGISIPGNKLYLLFKRNKNANIVLILGCFLFLE